MSNSRWLLSGFVLGLLASVAPSCGPAQPTCDASVCDGCCDARGVCQAGNTSALCGRAGAACMACSAGQECNAGICQLGSTTELDSGVDGGEGDGGDAGDAGDPDAGDSGAPDAGDAGAGGCGPGATVIPLFPAGTRVSGLPTSPNFQNVYVTATLPPGPYACIKAHFNLTATCSGPVVGNWPTACDPFDRISRMTVSKADPDGGTPGTGVPLFLIDAMTPFGGNAAYVQDVTDYAPFLVGSNTYAVHITTGADPTGSATGTDAGWNIEAFLEVAPGTPPRDVLDVQPLFLAGRYSPQSDGGVEPIAALVTAPPGATSARVDFFATGHGFKGPNSICDEFCQKVNVFKVDGSTVHSVVPWRSCANNCELKTSRPTSCGPGQNFNHYCTENPTGCPSSVIFDRAGWCPGRQVERRSFTLSPSLVSGTHTLEYSVTNLQGYFASGAAILYSR